MPEGLEVIGDSCFISTDRLRTVHLPDSLRKIERSAFYASSVKELRLPKGLAEIGKSAFYCCYRLVVEVYPSSYGEQYCLENEVRYSIVKSSLARERRTMQSVFMRQMIHNPEERDFQGAWLLCGVLNDTDLMLQDDLDQMGLMIDGQTGCAVYGDGERATYTGAALADDCLKVSGEEDMVFSLLLSEEGEKYLIQHVDGYDNIALAYRQITTQEYLTFDRKNPFGNPDPGLLAQVYEFEATVLEVREAEGCWLAGIRITSNGATTALVVTDGEELMKKMQSSGEFSISVKAMLLGWVRQDVPYFITNKVRIK